MSLIDFLNRQFAQSLGGGMTLTEWANRNGFASVDEMRDWRRRQASYRRRVAGGRPTRRRRR